MVARKGKISSDSASTRQLQSNAYPVTQTEDINAALAIQDNIINAVPVVQPVPSLVITHDPEEEELAWMENSLVGVISEGVNYQDFRKGLLCNGVQLTGFRFMGASQALISDNDACSFNPFPQYFHGKSYQRRKFLLFWCS
jgi:hypothetical protein